MPVGVGIQLIYSVLYKMIQVNWPKLEPTGYLFSIIETRSSNGYQESNGNHDSENQSENIVYDPVDSEDIDEGKILFDYDDSS